MAHTSVSTCSHSLGGFFLRTPTWNGDKSLQKCLVDHVRTLRFPDVVAQGGQSVISAAVSRSRELGGATDQIPAPIRWTGVVCATRRIRKCCGRHPPFCNSPIRPRRTPCQEGSPAPHQLSGRGSPRSLRRRSHGSGDRRCRRSRCHSPPSLRRSSHLKERKHSHSRRSHLPVLQNILQTQSSSNYNVAFASCLVAMAPAIIVFLFTRRWVWERVAQGAVKG